MVSDWLGFTLTSFAVAVIVQLYTVYVQGRGSTDQSGAIASDLGTAAALVLWTLVTLTTGRTIGDYAVQLRFDSRTLPAAVSRAARLVAGIGGYGLLNLLPGSWAQLSLIYAVLLIATSLSTKTGAGLPALIARLSLFDARAAHQPHRR